MFEYIMYCYGDQIMATILCAIFGSVGYAVKRLYTNYVNDETKRAVARAVVQFVEQAWKALHGTAKLQKALETAETLLNKKGIPFDADEMEVLIEAAVAEFNEAFKKPVKAEDSAAAVYRVPEAE